MQSKLDRSENATKWKWNDLKTYPCNWGLRRLNQSGQQRSKSSGNLLGSEQIPSKDSALIVTGIVKVQSTSCQVPILFLTTDS